MVTANALASVPAAAARTCHLLKPYPRTSEPRDMKAEKLFSVILLFISRPAGTSHQTWAARDPTAWHCLS